MLSRRGMPDNIAFPSRFAPVPDKEGLDFLFCTSKFVKISALFYIFIENIITKGTQSEMCVRPNAESGDGKGKKHVKSAMGNK